MNAFINTIQSTNTSNDTPSSTGFVHPIKVGTEIRVIYPENYQNLASSHFDLLKFVAECYSKQLGTPLVFRLTGYTDRNNYRFESSQFSFNGEWRRLVITMNRGILNVISD